MISFHFLLTLYWLLFAVSHSVLADWNLKTWLASRTGRYFRYYRLLYSCLAFGILGAVVAYQYSRPGVRLYHSRLVWVAGLPLALTGLYVMGVCIKKYFANLRRVDVFTRHTAPLVLEVGGLHRYMRHPLYAGTLLFMWSLFLMFPLLSNLIACVINTGYVLIGISLEERKLVKEYGEPYVRYAQKTPKLIPFLKPA